MTVQEAIELAQRHLQSGKWPDAEAIYQQLVKTLPKVAELHVNLGNVLQAQNRLEEALVSYRNALTLKPELVDAHFNFGIVMHKQGKLPDAVIAFRKALELNPNDADARLALGQALNNLGDSIYQTGEIEQALPSLEEAIAIAPEFAEAHNNLGSALFRLGRYQEAERAFHDAIARRPDLAMAHYNLGWALLLRGDYANGWPEYEWRGQAANFPQPRWDGSELNGRRIFIHAEQGFGDTFQFVRYLPMVAGRGGRIILGCPPETVRLLRNLPDIELFKTHGDPVPEFDVHCPLMSLPMIFGTTPETIPAKVPYLHADPGLSSQWKSSLPRDTTNIGIVWRARMGPKDDRNRSIPPEALAPLKSVAGVSWINLQKGESTDLLSMDWTSELKDFADSAALIDNLDLIITVDTAVAHLAGAMGKKVWTLLPFIPDWRWMLDREDSLWYPTMRLFRQTKLGDWNSPLSRIVEEVDSRHRS